MSKEKTCKNCGQVIDGKAVICTGCGVKIKKPIFKKWWFWVIIGIVVIAIGSSGGDDNENNNTQNTETVEQTTEPKVIEYTAYSVSELVNDLEDNALKAEDKYLNKYVEITGRLSNIDSDGQYISLSPSNDMFTFASVQCYIKNDEQKAKVMELSRDDIVTVRGKIKSIGEVLGYSLNIDSIN